MTAECAGSEGDTKWPNVSHKNPSISACSGMTRRRRSAAAACVEVYKGHAFVGSVGGSSGFAPEGFTVSDVTDPRKPRKVWEFKAPPGIHMHKLRVVGDHFLYVNSERLAGEKGMNARAGLFIFDISNPAAPREVGFHDMPGSRAAPLRRRQQAQARLPAQRCRGLEQPRDLDHGHQRSAQARADQHLGPALAEGRRRRHRQRPASAG